jgi:phage/plasmid primase-like uncharacterized protein
MSNKKTNKKNQPTFGQIAGALRNDPEPFASNVIGEDPTYRSGTQVRYFENQSLVVFTGGSLQGKYKSFTSDDKPGDMIDLYQEMRGGSKHDAIEYAKGFLGIGDGSAEIGELKTGPSDEERKKRQEEEDAKRIKAAQWIWSRTSTSQGRDEGLAYLSGRHITCDIPDSAMRFRKMTRDDLSKMLKPDEIPSTPVTALTFAARNADGDVVAVQQVLTSEGKKLRIEHPKRTNGLMSGAAVWLGDPTKSDKAVLVEGPETGGSVYQATGLPVCITLGKSNFTKVALPDNIKNVIIATDMEPSGVGLATALKAAQFWKDEGRTAAGIALPRLNDGDYNDIHQEHGEAAVKSGIDGAFYAPDRPRDGTILYSPDARAAFYAWMKTGIEVVAKVPPKKDGKYLPVSLDSVVEPHHNRVLVVGNKAIEIKDEYLVKSRPDVEITTISDDSKAFRALATTPGAIEKAINAVDIHAPNGVGAAEPIFVALRRADADALALPGYKSMAVRSSAVERIDFSFMKGREAIVAPIGSGTEQDQRLSDRLEEAGAKTTRLTWQIFRADEQFPAILRRSIPDTFGAADAAKEGWTGNALKDLVHISQANRQQMAKRPQDTDENTQPPAPKKRAAMER